MKLSGLFQNTSAQSTTQPSSMEPNAACIWTSASTRQDWWVGFPNEPSVSVRFSRLAGQKPESLPCTSYLIEAFVQVSLCRETRKFGTVGAVCDRAFLLESAKTKYGRSQEL